MIKAGDWYTYEDVKLDQGKEKVKENLETNPTLLEQINPKITF